MCPKKSPRLEHRSTLTKANGATLELYFRSRATYGRHLTDAEARDPWLAHLFALIDATLRTQEQATAATMAQALLGTKSHGQP